VVDRPPLIEEGLPMEELTFGDPDDWHMSNGTTSPPSGFGPATLDLTDDLGAPASGAGSEPVPRRIGFATFVVTEADRLLASAVLLTGERERAEELLRSALAAAAVAWEHSRREPVADVVGAMARECLGSVWWPKRFMDAAPLPGEIGAGLARLSGRQRVAVVLRYHQHLTEEEAAAAIGAPAGNVRSWLSQALDALGIDTRLDLRPEAGPGLSRSGLSTELAALATGVLGKRLDPEAAFDEALRLDARLSAVNSRLPALRRNARRRRTGTGIAIAVASVAVIAAGLALAGPVPDPILDDSAEAGAAAVPPVGSLVAGSERFERNQPEDPTRFRFRDHLAGDPLIASQVADRGRNDLTLHFTPESANLVFSQFCHSWHENGPWLTITLNGRNVSLEPCSAESRANAEASSRGSYVQAVGLNNWAGFGVRPGRESVLRLQLTSPEGRPLAGNVVIDPVRLGIAVYELSGPRVVSDGVVIKRQADVGQSYILGGYRTAKITKTKRTLVMTVPAGERPALLLAGIPDVPSQSLDRIRVTVNGTQVLAASNVGMFTFPLEAVGQQTVSIQARPEDAGVLVLAWYELSSKP
jgi:hypothetical protein